MLKKDTKENMLFRHLHQYLLLYRKKIVDGKTLTTKNVLKIFNNVQEDGDPVEGEDDLEDMEMSYSEFLEALAAVASFCNRSFSESKAYWAHRNRFYLASNVKAGKGALAGYS